MASEQDLQDAYEKARDKQADNPTPRGHEKQQEAADALQAERTKRKQSEADDPDHPRAQSAYVIGDES